jgi:hypothetical protein
MAIARMIKLLTRRWREFLLLATSLMLAGLLMEAGYRAFQYVTLPGRIGALMDATLRPEVQFDVDTGYRYSPNYDGALGEPWNSHWHTNSHGHVSRYEYPLAKPTGEYRVAVIGDSFTASITANVRWTEVLETELNSSPEWKAAVGGKSTRVINFGVDGMGMVQFGAMVQHHAVNFQPDLVVVNFIVDDILRRLTYRALPSADGGDRPTYVRKRFLSHVDWFGLCPALLAETVGRLWGMKCGLPLRADVFLESSPDLRYIDRAEALQAAAAAVRSIIAAAPAVIFVQAPLLQELENRPDKEWVGLVADLQSLVAGLSIISMQSAIGAFPTASFFVPRDGHYNDRGTTIYGREVARELIRHAEKPMAFQRAR